MWEIFFTPIEKKAIDEILQRSPTWPMPEEKVDNLFSTHNVANEEDLVKLRRENPAYYQAVHEEDLVAMHNKVAAVEAGNMAGVSYAPMECPFST